MIGRQHATAVGVKVTNHELQHDGLPATGGAHKSDHLTLANREVDLTQDHVVTERLSHPLKLHLDRLSCGEAHREDYSLRGVVVVVEVMTPPNASKRADHITLR